MTLLDLVCDHVQVFQEFSALQLPKKTNISVSNIEIKKSLTDNSRTVIPIIIETNLLI